MQQNLQTPEERRFLIEQARQLQQSGQVCKLVTNSEHSIITGNVREANDGGLVFEASGTGEKAITPWSNVAEFIVPPQGAQQSFSQAAGAGGGYNYGQQRS